MKGIYLTQEGKQEIEAKIKILEKLNSWDEIENSMIFAKCELYKDILSSATILPVVEDWVDIENKSFDESFTLPQHIYNNRNYPQGVIIQPKQ